MILARRLSSLSMCAVFAVALVPRADIGNVDTDGQATPAPITAKLTGRVTFEGPRPKPEPLMMVKSQTEGCCPVDQTVDATDPSLLIAEKGGIANVVVTIEVDGHTAKPREAPFVLDQRRCSFEPHVLLVTAGSKVEVRNSDQVAHNVRGQSAKNDPFNKTTAPGGKETFVFERADRVQIRCDFHPWMSSWIVVTATPYHALSDRDGAFTLPALPPGAYTVKVWHETLGRGEARAEIAADGTSQPLEIKMAEKKKKG